jgi:hypothetical protein
VRSLYKVLLGATVVASAGAAVVVALDTPSVMAEIRGVPAACEKEIVVQLVAPLEAKIMPGTRQIEYATFRACYQTRTRGGGYAVVLGMCVFDESGKPEVVTITENPEFVTKFCKG